MNRLRKIVNNTLISLVGQMITWTSTLLLMSAYGRFLGDVRFGELYFAITFVALVGFPIDLGFNQQLTRDVANNPREAEAYLWSTLVIKTLLWVPIYALALVLARVLGYSQEQQSVIAICGIDLFIGSIVSSIGALHYAHERVLYPAIGTILKKVLTTIVSIILLRMGGSVQLMAMIVLGGSVIDLLWQMSWFLALVGSHIVLKKEVFVILLKGSIPFIMYGVLGVIYYRIDTVMLSLMTNEAVIGWYGAGYRLFDTLFFIPNILVSTIMYPVFAKLSMTSTDSLKIAIEKCMNLLIICVLPIATLFAVAAPNIVGFLYHQSDFDHTIPVLQALAPGLIFLYFNTLFTTIVITLKSEKKMPIMAAIALVFNLGLNFYMIPRYQHVGAALVTSLTELLLFIIVLFFVPRSLFPLGSFKIGGKALLAACVMFLAVLPLRSFSIFVIIPVAGLVYVMVLTLLRTIPRAEILMLYQAVKNRRKGKDSTSDSLIDEDVYTRITEILPITPIEHLSELKTQILQATRIPEQVDEGASTWDGDLYTRITMSLPGARKQPISDLETQEVGVARLAEKTEIAPRYAVTGARIADKEEDDPAGDSFSSGTKEEDNPSEQEVVDDDATLHLHTVRATRSVLPGAG